MPVLLLPSICYAFFLTAENAKIMLYNKFQSPMKVTNERTPTYRCAQTHYMLNLQLLVAAGLVLFNYVFKAVGNFQRKCNIVACVGKPNLHVPTKNT